MSAPRLSLLLAAGEVQFTPQVSLPGTQFQTGKAYTITGKTLGEYISGIYFFVTWLAIIFAVFLLIVNGYRWLFAGGDPTRIGAAKRSIGKALSGLVVIIFAYMLLSSINPRLVEFDGISISSIKELTLPQIPGQTSGPLTCSIDTAATNRAKDFAPESKVVYNQALKKATKSGVSELFENDCTLLKAIVLTESNGILGRESSKHACGLGQVVPSSIPSSEKTGMTDAQVCNKLKNDPFYSARQAAIVLNGKARSPCPMQSGGNSAANCASPSLLKSRGVNGVERFRYAIAAYNGGDNSASADCPGSGQTKWECAIKRGGFKETCIYEPTVEYTYNKLVKEGKGC